MPMRLHDDEDGDGGDDAVGERRADCAGRRAATNRAEHEPEQHDERRTASRPSRAESSSDAARPSEGERARRWRAATDHAPSRTAVAVELDRGHGTAPNGDGRPSLPGLRMPFGSSAAFIAREHVEPGAERLGA